MKYKSFVNCKINATDKREKQILKFIKLYLMFKVKKKSNKNLIKLIQEIYFLQIQNK